MESKRLGIFKTVTPKRGNSLIETKERRSESELDLSGEMSKHPEKCVARCLPQR